MNPLDLRVRENKEGSQGERSLTDWLRLQSFCLSFLSSVNWIDVKEEADYIDLLMTLSQDLNGKNETPVKFEKTELTYVANVYLF